MTRRATHVKLGCHGVEPRNCAALGQGGLEAAHQVVALQTREAVAPAAVSLAEGASVT